MSRISIALSFDYELPLGGTGTSYAQSLFEPTDWLLSLAGKLSVPVTLFADILCALRYKEWDPGNFHLPFKAQLQKALDQGHDVQLHLHPHWLTSSYHEGRFIPSSDFILSAFRDKAYPNNIAGIVERSVSALEEMCREAMPEYKCVAYRGGGYNLSPASNEIFSALYSAGIRFDSSVCKGYYFRSALQEVHYKNMPAAANWLIGTDGVLTKEANTGIMEIPIAGKPKSIFEVPTAFKIKKYRHRAPQNRGKQIHEGKAGGPAHKLKEMFSSRMLTFDNYTYSKDYDLKILDHHIKKHSHCESMIVSAIGHPKSMSGYCFELFRSFVEGCRERYGDNIRFCTYRQLYDEMNLATH